MSIQLYTYVSRGIICFAGFCFSALAPSIATAEDYNVEINKTKIIRLPAPAGSIIVGNPEIADISVHSPTLLFVLGRGYGVTNVIILDDLGNTILESDIQVGGNQSGSGKRLMMAGQGWQSYDCSPFCQPSPELGNDPNFLANFKGEGQVIDNRGTPITATPFAGTVASAGVLNSTIPNTAAPLPNNSAPQARNAPAGNSRATEY